MKTVFTNTGSSVTSDVLKKEIKQFVLLGSTVDNDSTLLDLLNDSSKNNSLEGDLSKYIVSKKENISTSVVNPDRSITFTVDIIPSVLDGRHYVYAIALVADSKVYTINIFNETFNSIDNTTRNVVIKYKLSGSEINGNEFYTGDDEAYLSRRDFIEWASAHNHDDMHATKDYVINMVKEVDRIKENRETIGKLSDINSLNNSNIVNVLNEIIENVGNLNNLSIHVRDNLVNAINNISKILGTPELNLNEYNSVIEALNTIRDRVNAFHDGVFEDHVIVGDVKWSDKADSAYVGDIGTFHGDARESIVEAINEIYDIVADNKRKKHKITDIRANSSYKIFTKDQAYTGLAICELLLKGTVVCKFSIDFNKTPFTMKIYDVFIDDKLKNIVMEKSSMDPMYKDFPFGIALVYDKNDFYISVLDNEYEGKILFDRINFNYAKINSMSVLEVTDLLFSPSYPIREGAGIYNDDPANTSDFVLEKNKNYTLFDLRNKLEAKVELRNGDTTIASFKLTSNGSGEVGVHDVLCEYPIDTNYYYYKFDNTKVTSTKEVQNFLG